MAAREACKLCKIFLTTFKCSQNANIGQVNAKYNNTKSQGTGVL